MVEAVAIESGIGELTPRRLMGKDLFTALRIIYGTRGELSRVLRDLAAARADGTAMQLDMDVALTLAFALMEQADGEIRTWLADLAEVDVETFDSADLLNDIVPFVIRLVQQEDWSAFLARVSDLLGNTRAIRIASSTATAGRTRKSNGSRSRATSA
jgi:hypothetical protein